MFLFDVGLDGWTPEAVQDLRACFWKLSIGELQARYNTSYGAVRGQMNRQGLRLNSPEVKAFQPIYKNQLKGKRWSEVQDDYLRLTHRTHTVAQQAAALGTQSLSTIYNRLRALGFSKVKGNAELFKTVQAFKAEYGRYPRIGGNGGWHPDDAEGVRKHQLLDSSTIRRRFGGCLQEAWAASEGKPVELLAVKSRHLTLEQIADAHNVYKHLTGYFPMSKFNSTTKVLGWSNPWLAERLALPTPGGHGEKSLTRIRELALSRPLNVDLLTRYALTEKEVERARALALLDSPAFKNAARGLRKAIA